jgi:hypothetical protein
MMILLIMIINVRLNCFLQSCVYNPNGSHPATHKQTANILNMHGHNVMKRGFEMEYDLHGR